MPIAPAWREVGSQEGGPVNRTLIICLAGESPLGSQVKTSEPLLAGPSRPLGVPLGLFWEPLHLGGGGDPEKSE